MQEQMNEHVGVPGNAARRKIRGNIETLLLAGYPRRNLFTLRFEYDR